MFDKTIKPTLDLILLKFYGIWAEFRIEYGIFALIASIAVPLKLLLFYKLIGISANFFLVWLITVIFTYLLFASFKNKWIPAVIYMLLSILMLCDLTYSSFFNRYLSVGMMGAAGFLGDITESIKQVLKPWFFLVLVDAIIILLAMAEKHRKLHKSRSAMERTEILKEDVEEETDINSDQPTELQIEEISEDPGSTLENITEETIEDLIATLPEIETDIDENIDNEIESEIVTDKNMEDSGTDTDTSNQFVGRSRKKKKRKATRYIFDHKKPVAALLILVLLVFNVSGSFLITSLSNQEIYSYHIKDIVNAITGKSNIGTDYMYSITDSYQTEKNGPLFGVAKGKNLIVIQMESMQNLVINKTYNGQEITPNLNQIIKGNTIYFDHYYQQIGSGNTSDAEFATNNSIYGTLASYTYKLYADNYFKGLPKLLKEQGYETAVYHAHEDRDFWNREEAYKSLGFDKFYGGIGGTENDQYDMTEWMGWGLTDSEFFKQTIPYLKKMTQPFYSFIITLSNHHPYQMLDKYQFIKLLPEDQGTLFGNYLNSAAYTDYALGQLIQELKDEGIYDNSIIAFYGDHMGLPKSDEEIYKSVSRFLGKDYDFDTMMSIPLIITVPGAEQKINQTVNTTGGQLDFLPTIAYLMGFDSLDTVYLGHNLLTIDSGFVAEQTYMTKGSFLSDDIIYEMSRDGVFKNGRAWNPKTGKSVPIKDCYDGYMRSMGLINTSEYILKNDVLKKIYQENEDAVSAFSESENVIEYPNEIAVAGAPNKNLIGTNSLEALNASYDAGYRDIKINICWTEDKEAVLLSSWNELGTYFHTNNSQETTLEAFQNLSMRNGLTSMDYLDLIAWIKEHPDVKIVAQAERSADYFMKCMGSYAGSIMNQFIEEVPGMIEYTGLYPSILNIDIGKNTVDQLLEFIRLNNVAAVSMSKEAAEGAYKKILAANCISYVKNDENGLMTKNN